MAAERTPTTKFEFSNAAGRGDLDALRLARAGDPPCPWDEWACAKAAAGGHLATIEWLRAQDPPCPWSAATCAKAAEGGRLAILEWSRAQDPPCPWDERSCVRAAEGGHLDVLAWLRSRGCPWDERATAHAAAEGRLGVLVWLRAQAPPCPWGEDATTYAAAGGHMEVLEWLRARVPPCPWGEGATTEAARGGHLGVLRWLRSQDPPCPWNEGAPAAAASEGRLEVLRWILDVGPPGSWGAVCEAAVENGQLSTFQWLMAHPPSGASSASKEAASEAAQLGEIEAEATAARAVANSLCRELLGVPLPAPELFRARAEGWAQIHANLGSLLAKLRTDRLALADRARDVPGWRYRSCELEGERPIGLRCEEESCDRRPAGHYVAEADLFVTVLCDECFPRREAITLEMIRADCETADLRVERASRSDQWYFKPLVAQPCSLGEIGCLYQSDCWYCGRLESWDSDSGVHILRGTDRSVAICDACFDGADLGGDVVARAIRG